MQARNKANAQGIDVSHWQGEIDWQAVRGDGIEFVLMKATEGVSLVDRKLMDNVEGARRAGIPLGFYHFAHLSNDPVREADHFIRTTAPLHADLWHVLDVEGGSLDGQAMSRAQVSRWSRSWLERVQEATGLKPMLYTGAAFAATYFETDLSAYPLWIAHYGVDTPRSNTVWSRWTMFQYTDRGTVAGISGAVDRNELDGAVNQYLERKTPVEALGAKGDSASAEPKPEPSPAALTRDWQWVMLASALHGLYERSVTGQLERPLITDYTWAEQAYLRKMSADDLAWLAIVLLARDKGVEV